MKRHITYALLISLAMSGSAATKMDIGSRARLRAKGNKIEFVKNLSGKVEVKERHVSRAGEDETIRAFLTVARGTSASKLEAAGVTVQSLRGDIALVEFPQSILSAVEALDFVENIRMEAPVNLKLNKVRAASGVDKVHTGTDLPKAFTGKGVIAGIVDGGFDPNHINFKDENGNFRIKQISCYATDEQSGNIMTSIVKGDMLKDIDTDAIDSFHATHTTGIMAGGYKGKLTAGSALNFQNGMVQENVDNPYYGIAPEADIVAGAALNGALSDYFIAMNCERILDYAWDHKQPVALNLSLGSNVGPHDGSSMMTRYLDALVDDDQVNTTIVVAAGNEGDMPIAITKTLEGEDNKVATFIHPAYPTMGSFTNPRAGLIYIYSDSTEPFELQAQIYNKSRDKVAARYALTTDANGAGSQYWCSSSDWQVPNTSDIVDPQFAQYFEGYIGLNAEIDSQESGRYYAVIDFTMWDKTLGSNSKGNYIIGFEVTGKDGQRIDIYGDGNLAYFSGEKINGYQDGGYDGTINDIATGKKTIIVGSYNTCNYWGSLDGNVYGYWNDMPVGEMSSFTSFGKLVDGREMPQICAPGATVISSTSKYYLDEAGYTDADLQARVMKDNRFHDFFQCIGTSMAAPAVTGTVALMLEANPNLKAAQIRDILLRTAVKDDAVKTTGNPLQWGAGKLDSYAAVKEALNADSGLTDIEADHGDRIQILRNGGGVLDVLVPGAKTVNAAIYNVVGACVLKQSEAGNEIVLNTSSLVNGVYILKVNNNSIKIIK